MKQLNFFATCPKGLEQLLEEELKKLGAVDCKQTVAGVSFGGAIELAYKVCLWTRFANRVLLPLATFSARDADDLYSETQKIDWLSHLTLSTTFLVNFTGTSDTIKHTQFAAQKIKDAVVDQFRAKLGRRPSIDKINPMLRINGVLRKGKVTLSIDLSGESLHRRGYRLEGGIAPLKENVAAAVLYRAGWPEIAKQGGALVDPMCGSGTLLIEGMLIAADIAPGLLRKQFGFQGWKKFQNEKWQTLLQEAKLCAKRGKQNILSTFHGYDIDPELVIFAQTNIKQAGLASFIQVEVADVKHLTNKTKKLHGLCICNPPYGERLEDEQTILPLYRMFARKLKENFLNWEASMLTGNPELARSMGLRAYKKYAMFNGTIPCQLLLFHLKPEWFITPDTKNRNYHART